MNTKRSSPLGKGKIYAHNRKASFNYTLEDRYEAGLSLQGWEVKGIVLGRCQLSEARVLVRGGQAYLFNCGISAPPHMNRGQEADPVRPRRLLLHKRELRKLIGAVQRSGYTLIPVCIYQRGRYIKLEFSLAKGKKKYDKREALKKRDQERQARQAIAREVRK